MESLKELFKKETVFCISFILALISALVVKPDGAYLAYPDYRTISLLFCLMIIVAGFQSLGVFMLLGQFLLRRAGSLRNLPIIMVLLCFFCSMIITNDVTLITFVPFTMLVYRMIGKESQVLKTVVLETIAANLGSMATPIGNPQNLYLYSAYGIGLGQFAWAVLPYAALSLALLLGAMAFGKNEPLSGEILQEQQGPKGEELLRALLPFLLLLALCLLVVFRVLPYQPVLTAVAAVIFLVNRKLFREVDYFLLPFLLYFYRQHDADSGGQRPSDQPGGRKGAFDGYPCQPGDQQCAGGYPFVRLYWQLPAAAYGGEPGGTGNLDRFPGQPDFL